MAKVFGLHMIGLRAGVKGEDLETFFREKFAPHRSPAGMKWYLLKGDRGDREGRYLLMLEIESIETRTRLFPLDAPASAEFQQWFETNKRILEEWEKLASFGGSPTIWTDYVAVGETSA